MSWTLWTIWSVLKWMLQILLIELLLANIHIRGAYRNWQLIKAFASNLAFSFDKKGLIRRKVWSFYDSFLHKSSIWFLNVNLLSMETLSRRNLHAIDIQNIRIEYASSEDHKLKFFRISFQRVNSSLKYFIDHTLNLEVSLKHSYYSYTKYCRLQSYKRRTIL